jgi:hypothetical protein
MRIAKNSSPTRIVIGWLATRPRRDRDSVYAARVSAPGSSQQPG